MGAFEGVGADAEGAAAAGKAPEGITEAAADGLAGGGGSSAEETREASETSTPASSAPTAPPRDLNRGTMQDGIPRLHHEGIKRFARAS